MRNSAIFVLFTLVVAVSVRAQDHTVSFSTSDCGVSKAIPNWGLDTTWASADNMRRGLIFMGPENVNVVRVPFLMNAPLIDGDISDDQRANLQRSADVAALAGPNAMWVLSAGTGSPPDRGVDPWYQSSAGHVYPDRWEAAMEACQRYYNRPMWMVEPFNEPDYGPWGEGTRQNLSDIMDLVATSPNFAGTALAGGSTLNSNNALSWYDALGGRASVGTTHALAGSASNYVGFFQHVIANGRMPFHPEIHNLAEAIIGANYGLQGVLWGGTAELARGSFVKANQGEQLGYAEDLPNFTAAAVYRAPGGALQAFLGSAERTGGTTTYTFHCADRDVFYDGNGPQRDYTVTIGRNQERVINITWGDDVQPVVSGRYAIVNGNSGLVMEVKDASSTNGAILQQNDYSGASHQLWDIFLRQASDGDLSYFLMTNANSGLNADLTGWSYSDGTTITQYGYPGNAVEHWYFEYAGNGYFYIHSRWSNKCVSVSGGDVTAGAPIVQRSCSGDPDQLWQLESQ